MYENITREISLLPRRNNQIWQPSLSIKTTLADFQAQRLPGLQKKPDPISLKIYEAHRHFMLFDKEGKRIGDTYSSIEIALHNAIEYLRAKPEFADAILGRTRPKILFEVSVESLMKLIPD